jgi:TatD DNase family protein
MPLINFHTHLPNAETDVISVRSLFVSEISEITQNQFYTVGIHPWYAHSKDIDEQINAIRNLIIKPNILGIGEAGLDKLRGPSLEIQKKVLVKQIEIAHEVSKPIVIHCVKAWGELIEVKKMFNINDVKWAIHGFRGGLELAKQMLDAGFFLSYGNYATKGNVKFEGSLKATPINRLFLETDELQLPIGTTYSAVSQILNIPSLELENRIHQNFSNFFNRKF